MGSKEIRGLGWSRRSTALAAIGALLFVGACGSGDPEPTRASETSESPPAEVNINTFVFTPKSITVPVGTEVTWTNEDAILHTATSGKQTRQGIPGVAKDEEAEPDGTFDLQLDGKGSSATFTFEEQGTYAYFCTVHVAMTGRVVVE